MKKDDVTMITFVWRIRNVVNGARANTVFVPPMPRTVNVTGLTSLNAKPTVKDFL